MANEAKAIIVSVQYRLAPENPYPAAWDDAEDAFAWAAANAASFGGDPAMMAVGGDSAGGNLAIAVSCRRLAAGQPPPLYRSEERREGKKCVRPCRSRWWQYP